MKSMVIRGILAGFLLVGCSYFLTQSFDVARTNIANFFAILEGTCEPLALGEGAYKSFAIFCIITGIAAGTFATDSSD